MVTRDILKSFRIGLAYGSCNFENFQNITRKSLNALDRVHAISYTYMLLFSFKGDMSRLTCLARAQLRVNLLKYRGEARTFQRGVWGGGGSHCVKHYRHGVFTTEYCRLFV